MSILVITTGGTIGAVAVPDPQKPPKFTDVPPDGRDYVREALSGDFAATVSRCIATEHKDSKLFDDAYRDNLMKIIDAAPETEVLVTHGTDTILTTAGYFYDKMRSGAALKNKTVLLTGAMVPLANGHLSDGYLNLKFSLEQLSSRKLMPGVHIVLCDYGDASQKTGWAPRLYSYAPGRYQKYYDPGDGSRSRILVIAQ